MDLRTSIFCSTHLPDANRQMRVARCQMRENTSLPSHGRKPVRCDAGRSSNRRHTPVAWNPRAILCLDSQLTTHNSQLPALHSQPATRNSQLLSAFTLAEMLVTCALVAVLMLAVTQIFSIATKTIGGGQALGAAVRDGQGAQPVFARDFSAVAPASISPVFYITSQRIAAWRSAKDAVADLDGNALTFDYNANGVDTDTPDDVIPQGVYNFRNHRADTLGFFAIDRYARQTGNTNLVDADASREAWVWYGHLNLANNVGVADNTTIPGTGNGVTNPNNYYASQWALGRVAILMKNPANISGTGYMPRTTGDLKPYAFSDTSNTANTALLNFRYDLGGASMTTYKQDIIAAAAPLDSMIYEDGTTRSVIGRIRANLFQTRPLTPAAAAAQVPIFVPACTQFIVEYAGDFITQDGAGVLVSDPDADNNPDNNQDGRIDYVAGTGQVRWYGLPRDTNGDGAISVTSGDVVPVRSIATNAADAPTFERVFTGAGNLRNTPGRYVAAWGPNDRNRPKMIRITMVVDRPEAEGKLLDGQSFEYVFNVGY